MKFQKIENKNMNSRYFEKSSTLDVVFFFIFKNLYVIFSKQTNNSKHNRNSFDKTIPLKISYLLLIEI